MTRATRLLPSVAGVSAQMSANDGAVRGWDDAVPAAVVTAKRQPCTDPSAGMSDAGPAEANVQVDSPGSATQYVQ